MALQTPSILFKQSSDAEFRAWGKAISDALTAIGIPKTGDAGQIDWSSVAAPAAGSTVKGYEIRQFNDTLQASKPILIKLEFGSATSATVPSLWITIGTATDNAGNLTGLTTTRKQLYNTAATVAYTTLVSGDANRVALFGAIDSGSGNYSVWFVVERTHDAAGADTDEGFLYTAGMMGAGNLVQGAFIFGTGAIGTETAVFSALVPSVGSGASGAAVALYPIFCTRGIYFNPFLNILVAFQTNVTPGVALSFTYYGATRKFIPLNNASTGCAVRGAVAGVCLLVRDE